MTTSECRAALLAQHARLRDLLSIAVEAARRPGDDLRGALTALRLGLAEHAATEEALLVPLLRHGDAWSPDRIDQMMAGHFAEHAAFRAALDGDGDADIARRLEVLDAELRAHMNVEERTFLAPGVLRDDLVTVDITS